MRVLKLCIDLPAFHLTARPAKRPMGYGGQKQKKLNIYIYWHYNVEQNFS